MSCSAPMLWKQQKTKTNPLILPMPKWILVDLKTKTQSSQLALRCMSWINANNWELQKVVRNLSRQDLVSTVIASSISYTSWLTHTSRLGYSGVAQSLCSTEWCNLISDTVKGLAADKTLQPELPQAAYAISSAHSPKLGLPDRWAAPCCRQRGCGSQGTRGVIFPS